MSDLNKLLDNRVCVVMFKNLLGSYTVYGVSNGNTNINAAIEDADEDGQLTHDLTPEDAAARLADKMMGCGDYAEGKS